MGIILVMGFPNTAGRGKGKKREYAEVLVSHFGVSWESWQKWCYRRGGRPTDPELLIKRFFK